MKKENVIRGMKPENFRIKLAERSGKKGEIKANIKEFFASLLEELEAVVLVPSSLETIYVERDNLTSKEEIEAKKEEIYVGMSIGEFDSETVLLFEELGITNENFRERIAELKKAKKISLKRIECWDWMMLVWKEEEPVELCWAVDSGGKYYDSIFYFFYSLYLYLFY
jgi:hypothetical protein